jgi:2-dehydro-3-deoxy-D-arabinonate dehydratase
MKLYRTIAGPIVSRAISFYRIPDTSWDALVAREDLLHYVKRRIDTGEFPPLDAPGKILAQLLPPIQSQEVWAAGVTYWRSREARMEESKSAGGGDFYDRVYAAARPELFFKASGTRVVGHGQKVRIRKDAKWSVPEPELTLLISPAGKIAGYTIGNDMSSRDIEGENPLYLPQAKVYDGSCALGPCIFLTDEPLPITTKIQIHIHRAGSEVFHGETTVSQIKRELPSLVEYLYRESSYPHGCYLMTGTGVVPPDSFTLQPRDEIAITIEPIGTLVNVVGHE